MKKIIGIVCILLCFGSMFVFARGSSDNSSTVTEIKFWSLFTGGDGEFFDAMVEEFNRTHPDIRVTSDTVKFDNYYTRLTAALTSKTAPDVVVIHQSNLLPYEQGGTLIALDSLLEDANAPLSDFVPAALDPCRYEGVLYALPLDVHPIILYYNTELFEKAGITKPPQTFEEFVAAAEAVEATGSIGLSMENTTAASNAYTLARTFISGLAQLGGSVLTTDNSKADFNNASGIQVVGDIIDLVNKYGVVPKGYDYDTAVTDFRLGKAGMHINGVWVTGTFESQADLNFAAIPFPPLYGEQVALAGSHTLALPVQKTSDPQKLAAAVEFMLWMTEHGELWAKAGHIPIRTSVFEKEAFTSLPYRADYADVDSVIAH
ncbi:MAG: ABC transporter substrate-binding protein, partial [Spirochaetales bacterium]